MEVDVGVGIVTGDLAGGVDTKGAGGHAIRVVQVRVLAAAEQEAMQVEVRVQIGAHDLAAGVDPVGLRAKSARVGRIDGAVLAVIEQKGVCVEVGIKVAPRDLTAVVDADATCKHGARYVQGREL